MRKLTTGEVVSKFKDTHGDIYNYEKVDYINNKKKVIITCRKHGDFNQLVNSHIKGQGCPECSRISKIIPSHEILLRFNKKHNNLYRYDLSDYSGIKSKIKVICEKHGHLCMSVSQHLNGYGCQKCDKNNRKYKYKNPEEIEEKFHQIHNNKYTYPNLNTISDSKSKIEIICEKHGKFEQRVSSHMSGSGCYKCNVGIKDKLDTDIISNFGIKIIKIHKNKVRYFCNKHGEVSNTILKFNNAGGCVRCNIVNKSIDKFRKKLNDKFGDRYTFSDSEFNRMKDPIKFYDNKNGYYFIQSPSNRILDRDPSMNLDIFKFKSKLIHGDKYSYEIESDIIASKSKIDIICNKHGKFEQIVNNHLSGANCPKCSSSNIISYKEVEISDYLSEYIEVETNNRTILDGKELDIYIPSKNIAIEFNGLYWHSELYKDKNYHLDKTERCIENGVNLIHVWEDDWKYKQDIVKSMLLNKIGQTPNKIYARKTEVKVIQDTKIVSKFIEENHLQGKVGSKIKLGLYHENELISLMTFGSLRKNLGQESKKGHYELLRFCNKKYTSVIGGASKLFKYFITNYKPLSIISYANRDHSDGNLYKQLGFILDKKTKPNYYYIKNNFRYNRFNFRKDVLTKEGYNKNKTEKQIMLERGYYRIYDSGSYKYIIDKNKGISDGYQRN